MELLDERWEVFAPATGQKLATLTDTSTSEIDEMIAKGRAAFSIWSTLPIKERVRFFTSLRLTIVAELDAISKSIAEDTGKVLTEAIVADIMPTLDSLVHIEKHAEKMLSRQKVSTPLLLFGSKSYIEYMPRGMVLVISPWNYPFQLAMIPVLSALVSGNTVLLKPSEVTPMVGLLIERLFKQAGFPTDVVQVVHGGKQVGAELTQKKPDYIFFTGSVRTGKIIQEIAAKELIPTTLELGGKDPMVVFADADLKRAAKGAAWGAFTNSGQVCMSVERLLVEEKILPELAQELKIIVSNLRHGVAEDDDIGSMTFPGQIEIVRRHVEDALEKGAKLLTGKKPSDWDPHSMFLEPMILTDVTQDMDIVQEETFGPVLPIMPFSSEEEAVGLANNTEYGLNASVWSRDSQKAQRVASKIIAGAVVINDTLITVANPHLPFGGTKNSGIGRYHGENGLRIFCHEKAIMQDMGLKANELQWYPYKGKFPVFKQLFTSYFGKSKSWSSFAKTFLKLLKLSKN